MRITFSASTLKTVVKAFNRIIPRSTRLPVLRHVLVRRTPDGIGITASNLDGRLTYRLGEGTPNRPDGPLFLIPFDALRSAGKEMRRGSTLTVEAIEGPAVTVTAEIDGTAVPRTVETMPVDEFPTAEPDIALTDCDPLPLVNGVRDLSTFASSDPTRMALSGVLAHLETRQLAATDGRRLTCLGLDPWPFDRDVILPATKLLQASVLDSADGGIGLAVADEQSTLCVRSGPWFYTARCVDATYPNYRQVIPDEVGAQAHITFSADEVPMMVTALRQLVRNEATAAAVYGHGERVALLAASGDAETPYTCIELPKSGCDAVDPLVVQFNPQYLMDALKLGFSEAHVIDSFSPVRFSGIEGGLHVVMPLRETDADCIARFMDPAAGEEAAQSKGDTETMATDNPQPQAPAQERSDAQSGETGPGQLTIVETPDPLTAFMAQLADAQSSVQAANAAVRDLKRMARDLERAYRAREKEIAGREREFEKSAKLITKLQEAMAA